MKNLEENMLPEEKYLLNTFSGEFLLKLVDESIYNMIQRAVDKYTLESHGGPWICIKQAAKIYGVSVRFLYGLQQKRLIGTKKLGNKRMVSMRDLDCISSPFDSNGNYRADLADLNLYKPEWKEEMERNQKDKES